MFKLIAANAQGSLRPALLQKIKTAAASNAAQLSSTISPVVTVTSAQIYQFTRNNSSTTTNNTSNSTTSTTTKLNEQVNLPPKITSDPLVVGSTSSVGGTTEGTKKQPEQSILSEIEIQKKLDHFSQLVSRENKVHFNDVHVVEESMELFEIPSVRERLTFEQVEEFTYKVERLIYHSKNNRLRNKFNRDRDESGAFYTEVKIQQVTLKLFDMINSGLLTHCVSADVLYRLFLILHSFHLKPEVVSFWELGVSNPETAHLFVDQKVLSSTLLPAYEMKRFSYDEVKQIYDINTPNKDRVYPELLTSIGKVALLENDYSHALDIFEQLMISLKRQEKLANSAIAEMHLNFISSCREIEIAKHFFQKAIDAQLPYSIRLKAPHMISFMRNCVEAGDSMESIIKIWRLLVLRSQSTAKFDPKGAKAANLHSGLFKIFFDKYPDSCEEGKKYFKMIFDKNPKINEIFLNAAISNYSWNDKKTFDELVDCFEKYNIERSMISNRVILKQAGLFEYTNEELIQSWDDLLHSVDSEQHTYIGVPDWAAIRDATILSEKYNEERTGLYFSIVKAYKDYMQNERACVKFLRGFSRSDKQLQLVKKFADEEDPKFDNEVEITIPKDFVSLKKHVDFRTYVQHFFMTR